MPTISGRLMFDRSRTATASTSLAGIAGVTIALQNTNTWQTLTMLTDSNGNYSFTNVPAGNYQIVEAYGVEATSTTRRFYSGDYCKYYSGGSSAY